MSLATRLPAQSSALSRAMDLEMAGQARAAVTAYRDAMREGVVLPALLGLERAYALMGESAALVPLVDSLLREMPREVVIRTVQMRLLRGLGDHPGALAARRAWIAAAPRDPAPYREWTRVLLAEGRTAAADSLLDEATTALGSTRALVLEAAQLRAALGQWADAAQAWRDAMLAQTYLESAAQFSLRSTPVESRREVRRVLLAAPVVPTVRRILALLELGWGNGREGWAALRELPASDEVAAIWSSYAEEAERAGSWLAARDALVALQRWRPDEQRALRAAALAIDGGDAQSALTLADVAAATLDDTTAARVVAPIRLRAFAALGRGAEAAAGLAAVRGLLPPTVVAGLQRDVAWAWLRAGDVVAARRSLVGTAVSPDEPLAGWLALYEGDLTAARVGLRRADPTLSDAVTALAVLVRTRAARSPEIGAAFLALAAHDSARAARAFEAAADAAPDAASVLLLVGARLEQRRARETEARRLWSRILASYADTPEAAEAELEWARSLRASGDRDAAILHLEHLILTWPQSALLPQARRELDLARGKIPPVAPHV